MSVVFVTNPLIRQQRFAVLYQQKPFYKAPDLKFADLQFWYHYQLWFDEQQNLSVPW
jgi:hypothetical protein